VWTTRRTREISRPPMKAACAQRPCKAARSDPYLTTGGAHGIWGFARSYGCQDADRFGFATFPAKALHRRGPAR
jgi:hypothetical protein